MSSVKVRSQKTDRERERVNKRRSEREGVKGMRWKTTHGTYSSNPLELVMPPSLSSYYMGVKQCGKSNETKKKIQ